MSVYIARPQGDPGAMIRKGRELQQLAQAVQSRGAFLNGQVHNMALEGPFARRMIARQDEARTATNRIAQRLADLGLYLVNAGHQLEGQLTDWQHAVARARATEAAAQKKTHP